ncbi:uracil-DNA glycosylase [Psittacicella hinzii]|uniref:Uracil-DNA glycosylase n=2 Tax=Psittacicella hinzii TaxID=2028575 RepID=A0A3A1YAT5_9GAMM|nr:uracil-DNA glycosylase [Psittacicella hinzii]
MLKRNWPELANYLQVTDHKGNTLWQQVEQIYLEHGQTVRPLAKDLFNAFSIPLTQVKVVIVGQDPYASDHAHGLAFSSAMDRDIPKSLQNIFLALKNDFGEEYQPHVKGKANLQPWVEQGVLLLNTRLTVEIGCPLNPLHDIWQEFINLAFNLLAQKSHLVYLLWGKHAQSFASHVNAQLNLILKAPHPSPLSAYRGFFTCGCFKQTNQYLLEIGQSTILW